MVSSSVGYGAPDKQAHGSGVKDGKYPSPVYAILKRALQVGIAVRCDKPQVISYRSKGIEQFQWISWGGFES